MRGERPHARRGGGCGQGSGGSGQSRERCARQWATLKITTQHLKFEQACTKCSVKLRQGRGICNEIYKQGMASITYNNTDST